MKGILLIDKPAEWTSSDVVAKLRGMLRQKRIGHSGTLDPMATGLLAVFVGRATRAVDYAENQSKRYIARIRLGLSTDTEDITGNVIIEREADISEEQLRNILPEFTGEIDQVPPMYSAIKVKGQKLYNIARNGGHVEREPRHINILSLDVIGREEGDFVLDIRCSKGTYIRSLCRDIGERLGCGACMSYLRRIETGDFKIEDALTLDDVQAAVDRGEEESLIIPLDKLFSEYESCTVSDGDDRFIRCGGAPRTRLPAGNYRVYSQGGEFISISHVVKGRLETIKSFFEV